MSNPNKVPVNHLSLLSTTNSSFVVAVGEFPPAPFIKTSIFPSLNVFDFCFHSVNFYQEHLQKHQLHQS